MFTRQGHSPNVKFPRILGIEATGLVEEAPSGEFTKGDVVATAMGEMGRAYDGGYVSGRSFFGFVHLGNEDLLMIP
jgi:NADPH:quinone reductase-like Zn-dependent oxidoreductase